MNIIYFVIMMVSLLSHHHTAGEISTLTVSSKNTGAEEATLGWSGKRKI
jgi:hypothetical protein